MRVAARLRTSYQLVPRPPRPEHSRPPRVAKIERIGYTLQGVGYRAAYRRGFGCSALFVAMAIAVPSSANIPPSRAATDGAGSVVVACPDLPEATAAELEARARASLLTSDIAAAAAISCMGEGAIVQVDAGDDSVTIRLRVPAATLREEVLRALDRALADLRTRVPTEAVAAPPAPRTAPVAPVPRLDPASVETPPPSSTPRLSRPVTVDAEVGAHALGESWGDGLALGGGLRTAVRFDATWSCGIRAGALHALRLDEATVIEAHAVLEAAVTARSLAGLRFGLGVGPSLLFASPKSGFVAPGATLQSAVRVEAQVGRPFRWRGVELTPWVGARAFTAERGVRVAEQARLIAGGLQPQLGLALSLIP